MDTIPAKREHGTAHKMSNKTRILPFQIMFTKEQFELLKFGRVPEEMGDRWFIFYEDAILNFHWWVGPCIYKISFSEKNNCIVSDEIIVVNDKDVKPILNDVEEFNNLKSIIKYSLLQGQEFIINPTTI